MMLLKPKYQLVYLHLLATFPAFPASEITAPGVHHWSKSSPRNSLKVIQKAQAAWFSMSAIVGLKQENVSQYKELQLTAV